MNFDMLADCVKTLEEASGNSGIVAVEGSASLALDLFGTSLAIKASHNLQKSFRHRLQGVVFLNRNANLTPLRKNVTFPCEAITQSS